MKIANACLTTALVAGLAFSGPTLATEAKITPTLDAVEVIHNGQIVSISRSHEKAATIPEIYQKTSRGCPPFCVQPIAVAPGVETIGELEMLDYLSQMSKGDKSILVVDSRTPDWAMRGTIPGSVNIPWTRINQDTEGTFMTPAEADTLTSVLTEQCGATQTNGSWDFAKAKTLVLFCNGIWCAQSSINIKTLVDLGYPPERIKWYRGGMQDWVSVGLTTVQP